MRLRAQKGVDMARALKLVTPENWLEPDPLSALIVKMDHRDGTVSAVDGRDWITYVNGIAISDGVPPEVRAAYEFMVGAIGYAYFYYPIFTIVIQQLLRVADFAVAHLFDVRDDLPKTRTFEQRIKVLKDIGALDTSTFVRWNAIRQLRNEATHPQWQQTWGHPFLDVVSTIAELVSQLPWPAQKGGA
jgi:hypothetical protein